MVSQQSSPVFYYSNGERVPLVPEPAVYAVKFKPGSTSRVAAFSQRTSRFLREDSDAVGFIPHYGLQVYQRDARDSRSRALVSEPDDAVVDAVCALGQETAVEFAAMAYRRPATGQRSAERAAGRTENADLLFITQRFLVQFKPDVTQSQIDALNAEHQVEIIEALDYADNGYLLEAPESAGDRGALALANRYYESDLTLFAHPDYIWRRHFRATALSPVSTQQSDAAPVSDRASFLAEQWHLKTAKVTDAWNITKGSTNITIAILDDGTDTTHPEFAGKVVAEYDFANHVANGNPKTASDSHGTACAGVATAKGIKSFGAAPDCQLMAVRTPDFLGVADEANMFRWVADQGADIVSCSWGPADGNGTSDPLPDNVRSAIHYCVTTGRGGKGMPIFWAAGNGDESVSLDGYAANPEVVAVAASTSNERRAWYSDFGPEVWISAPSSGDSSLGDRRIFTTDRRGGLGYNTGLASKGDVTGDYTNDFGGTSSATPLVAGIAGLMLSANENLTPDDVKDILKRTADKIGNASDYDASGHSNLYGYGRVNAQAAVDAAKQTGSPTAPAIQGPVSLPRSGSAPTFEVNLAGRRFFAIEVATQASLFDGDSHGSDRTEHNFYGSWQDSPLLTRSPYTLPAAVWQRLKQGDRLYY
ncbi:MAG: S8 family serine peptidase, partial [Phormidesmis sp.]